jgi:hypothetical protein
MSNSTEKRNLSGGLGICIIIWPFFYHRGLHFIQIIWTYWIFLKTMKIPFINVVTINVIISNVVLKHKILCSKSLLCWNRAYVGKFCVAATQICVVFNTRFCVMTDFSIQSLFFATQKFQHRLDFNTRAILNTRILCVRTTLLVMTLIVTPLITGIFIIVLNFFDKFN